MLLGSEEIKRLILEKEMIKGYKNLDEQLQPNGFDLTLDKAEIYSSKGVISCAGKILPKSIEMDTDFAGMYNFDKGGYLIFFNEEVNLPKNIAAISVQRSTIFRSGAMINVGSWDAGYNGKGCNILTVFNADGLSIEKDARVVQLHFIEVKGKSHGYNGQYQHENLNKIVKKLVLDTGSAVEQIKAE